MLQGRENPYPAATRRPPEASMARPPVFLMAQTACLTCGEDIADPLTLEELGRYCSPRCFHGRGLPRLFGPAA